jgi:hypothetical protein
MLLRSRWPLATRPLGGRTPAFLRRPGDAHGAPGSGSAVPIPASYYGVTSGRPSLAPGDEAHIAAAFCATFATSSLQMSRPYWRRRSPSTPMRSSRRALRGGRRNSQGYAGLGVAFCRSPARDDAAGIAGQRRRRADQRRHDVRRGARRHHLRTATGARLPPAARDTLKSGIRFTAGTGRRTNPLRGRGAGY